MKHIKSHASSINLAHLQLEEILEEMLVLCQRAEEYNQFILEKAADAVGPSFLLPAAYENALRSGSFNTAVRELISYYINLVGRQSVLALERLIERSTGSV